MGSAACHSSGQEGESTSDTTPEAPAFPQERMQENNRGGTAIGLCGMQTMLVSTHWLREEQTCMAQH